MEHHNTIGCILAGRSKTLLLKNCVLLRPDPSQHVWRWVRAISDPLEHLLNQVEIKHHGELICKQFKEREIRCKTETSCGRISVELGQARGKYGQPKHYPILYVSIAHAT